MLRPLAFISYRREDYAAAARGLKESLEQAFGAASVFMDVENIKPGDEWPGRIQRTLKDSTVVLAIIGPTWLRISDEYGRRRIDKEEDWVRREIEASEDKILIPVLVGGAVLPPAEALPSVLSGLVRRQAIALRDSKWGLDVSELISLLESEGFVGIRTPHIYPILPCNVGKQEVPEGELTEILPSLVGWQLFKTRHPEDGAKLVDELCRTFEFRTFEEAMDFMRAGTEYISKLNHHPRRENTWRMVTVWLTTWDLGHKISSLDLQLAGYFNSLYDTFKT